MTGFLPKPEDTSSVTDAACIAKNDVERVATAASRLEERATRRTLPSLPLEVLQHIAVHVETAHWPSLQAFSLTSKVCHEASVFLIFRRISITVYDRDGLRRDVDALIKTLSHTDSFRHIKQITIKGALGLKAKRIEGHATQTPWSVTTGLADILDEEPVSWHGVYAVYDESIIKKSSEEDMAWAPLVNLLQAKIPLKDLVYDCHSQFPPSLLGILHEQHPQCRLHHLTFKFRSLLWGVPLPYEMELATSPCLYRVKVTCTRRDSDGDDDFNLEAMMELTSGLAPNLREVVVLNLSPGGSQRGIRPRESWQGLPGFTCGTVGSLKSLSLKGVSRLNSPAILQDWARHINFASLQHLTLGGCSEAQSSGLSGETMQWIAQTQSFPQVKTLCVYLTRDDVFAARPHYSEHAIAFLQAFGSLERLSIDGPIDAKIMDSVLTHFGQTLKRLSLRPFEETSNLANGRERWDVPFNFTRDRVLQIEAQCPVLEELTIPVRRNKSSASEAEIYRSFGRIRSLRSLFLILDCSNWRVVRDRTYNPVFDEEDRQPLDSHSHPSVKRGHLKETFINCAVDEVLARSIWNVISQNKTGRRLERLKLWPTGEDEYGTSPGLPYTFTAIAWNLTRSWLFERDPRDDREDFTVAELRKERREARDQDNVAYCAYGHNPKIWEVFRSIWPSQSGSKDWRDDWSSYPL